MSYAYLCEVCGGPPTWRLDRYGDAAVSWACDADLPAVARRMQRDQDTRTQLAVTVFTGPALNAPGQAG